jgi:hypothetical protein
MKIRVTERFKDGSKAVVEGKFLSEDGRTIKVGTEHGVREIPSQRMSSIHFFLPRRRSFIHPH